MIWFPWTRRRIKRYYTSQDGTGSTDDPKWMVCGTGCCGWAWSLNYPGAVTAMASHILMAHSEEGDRHDP